MPTVIYPPSSGSSGGGGADLIPEYVDADFSIATGKRYFVDTVQQAITATLDGSLENAKDFELVDIGGKVATNNLTLDLNNVRLEKLPVASNPVFSSNSILKKYRYFSVARTPTNTVKAAFNISGQNNQYVEFPIGNKGSAYTMSAWVTIKSDCPTNIEIFTFAGSGNQRCELTYNTSGRLGVESRNSSGQENGFLFSSTNYGDNTEHFITFIKRSGTSYDLYVDGTFISNQTTTYSSTANTYLRVAQDADGSSQARMIVRELAVWDRILTSGEITEAYNSGTPTNLSSHSAVANLDHWWTMDEDETVKANPALFEDEIASADGTYQNLDNESFDIVSTSYSTQTTLVEEKPQYEFPDAAALTPHLDNVTGVNNSTTTVTNYTGRGKIHQIMLVWETPQSNGNRQVSDLEITIDGGSPISLGGFNANSMVNNSPATNIPLPLQKEFSSSLQVDMTLPNQSGSYGDVRCLVLYEKETV